MGRSSIMELPIIAVFGLLACLIFCNWFLLSGQWECTPGKEFSRGISLSIVYNIRNAVSVCVIAFLLQGILCEWIGRFDNNPFWLSQPSLVGLEYIPLRLVYLFGFGIPLFIDSSDHSNRMKWSLWIVLTAVYGLIMFMYHAKWRERLPARPAFYNYIAIMFILNALALFACALTGHGLVLVTDFFQEEGLNLENVYYSEMKDAGFFDDDWD
ncbi:LOW QUALITY PROTEIN: hypothetical protein NC652_012901 [Populus alba x Populus x berolinensis]|nr:LOW QUALITY PROTEIN: hypothetical protein NC652_012901 [Populus alba x Populus x berolinensis]